MKKTKTTTPRRRKPTVQHKRSRKAKFHHTAMDRLYKRDTGLLKVSRLFAKAGLIYYPITY